ncbi:MAG: hypothetical protein KC613_00590 [Myxococcales bacterium]|nr:hypothetical protein [Myxococcales bacterium]MCB9522401.1 hypothetical protein [Myxococcales bacterium]
MLAPLFAALVLAPAPPGAFKTDAYFQDWEGVEALRVVAVQGACGDADVDPTVQLAFDGRFLRFAVQVRDDRFVPGATTGDRLSLRIGLPNGARRTVTVQLNDLEPPHAAKALLDGKPLRGGELVATARRDGWAVEGAVPLTALPGATDAPLKLAVIVEDVDADPVAAEAVCSTAALQPDGLPGVPTVDLGGVDGFASDFLAQRPAKILKQQKVQLLGGPEKELLLLTSRDLMVAGHALPGGVAGYLYFEHGWPADTALTHFELRELDGRKGPEVALVRQSWAVPGETRVDVLEIYLVRDDTLVRAFAGQVAEHAPPVNGDATARWQLQGRPAVLKIHPAKVTGFNPGNVVELAAAGTAWAPIPWPWHHRGPVIHRLQGDRWVEETRP